MKRGFRRAAENDTPAACSPRHKTRDWAIQSASINLPEMSQRRVIIVGGGAAGIFAAITCAERAPGAIVTVLEKGPQFLAKVRVSGGGRCNVTHACFEPAEFVTRYPRGARALLGPFHRFQARDTVTWFESRGVKLKTEADGRMFPITDSSQTIIDCLLRAPVTFIGWRARRCRRRIVRPWSPRS